MTKEKLVKELLKKKESGLKISQLETIIGLPMNSMSKVLKNSGIMPESWIAKIETYLSSSNTSGKSNPSNTSGNPTNSTQSGSRNPTSPSKQENTKMASGTMDQTGSLSNSPELSPQKNKMPAWAQEIVDYCVSNSLEPQDLITWHKEVKRVMAENKSLKAAAGVPQARMPVVRDMNREAQPAGNTYFARRQAMKLGLKPTEK